MRRNTAGAAWAYNCFAVPKSSKYDSGDAAHIMISDGDIARLIIDPDHRMMCTFFYQFRIYG